MILLKGAYHASHPSIMDTRAHTPADFHFDFHPVQPEETLALLLNLNVKAVGLDVIPARLLCDTAYIVAETVTYMMVCTNTFPECLKYAEVSPVFKKDDPLTHRTILPS